MLAARRLGLVLSKATTNNLALNCSRNGRIIGVGPTKIHVATLKATHGDKYPYHPNPYPYEKKKFNIWHETWEWASDRMNENSKIITVEGNVAVGKNKFAERLAAEFDFKYFPAVPEDVCFKFQDYDLRELDELLPEAARTYGLKKLLSDTNPGCGRIARLQSQWFNERINTYLKASNHVLSTGQGVVVVKSPYGDHVFAEVLKQMGWMSQNFFNYYDEIRKAVLMELLAPHLTIYLDASINTLRDRIKARNDPREVGARNLTDKFLEAIDTTYKQKYLPGMRRTGEVLEIDWETEADDLDMDAIAEDIAMLSYEGVDNEDPKFLQWTRLDEDSICTLRKIYQDPSNLNHFFQARGFPYECKELTWDFETADAFDKVVRKHPAIRYEKGWAPEFGNLTTLKM